MIVDSFTFFNELELLDLRLNYLSPLVDRFILVEATKDHTGNPKKLYYDENKSEFKKFFSKVFHIIVNDMPEGPDTWGRENHQRNCISIGFHELENDDYIMVSDLDEIPDINLVERKLFGAYNQKCFMYYLNAVITDPWIGTVGMTLGKFRSDFHTLQNVRNRRQSLEPIKNGGWHFAWLGGYERVKQKLMSFAHTELQTPHILSTLENSVNNRIPLWCPDTGPIQVIPVHEIGMDYLTDNLERYMNLIYQQK